MYEFKIPQSAAVLFFVCGVVLMFVFNACGSGDAVGKDASMEASRKAKFVSESLMGTLMGELTAATKEGGPSHAITYCSEHAQAVTERLAEEHGVGLRRVTTKPRSPVDYPDEWEEKVLEEFERLALRDQLNTSVPHEEILTVEGTTLFRSMRPIVIRQACLTCHGGSDDIPPDVARLIREQYPNDKATGYSVGDFRGAISVTVPLHR